MSKRVVEKAWCILTKNKLEIEKSKRSLEKENYRVTGVSDLSSGENVMITAERRIATVV